MPLVIQVVGSALVLAGFFLSQLGRLDQRSIPYLTANSVGSGILAVNALITTQWGFLALEGVWAVVSLVGLVRALKTHGHAKAPGHRG